MLVICVFQIVLIIQVHVNPSAVKNLLMILVNADQHLYNLLILSALLDPIIYAIRIREMRQNYADVLRQMCFCLYLKWKMRNASSDLYYASVTDARQVRRMSRPCNTSITDVDRDRRMSGVCILMTPVTTPTNDDTSQLELHVENDEFVTLAPAIAITVNSELHQTELRTENEEESVRLTPLATTPTNSELCESEVGAENNLKSMKARDMNIFT